MWNNAEYRGFIKEVVSNYDAIEDDVSSMLDLEISSAVEYRKTSILNRYSKSARTSQITASDITNAILLCRGWMNESRLTLQDLTPAYVASHRRSAIYFQLLNRR